MKIQLHTHSAVALLHAGDAAIPSGDKTTHTWNEMIRNIMAPETMHVMMTLRTKVLLALRGVRRLTAVSLSVAAVTLAGCNPAAKFSVAEATGPTIVGDIEAINGRATVTNGTRRDLTVESAHIVLRYRDRELGTARLLLPVEVPAREQVEVRYDLAVEGLSMAEVRALSMRLLSNPAAVTADITARVRWGAFRKHIALKDIPVTRLIPLVAP